MQKAQRLNGPYKPLSPRSLLQLLRTKVLRTEAHKGKGELRGPSAQRAKGGIIRLILTITMGSGPIVTDATAGIVAVAIPTTGEAEMELLYKSPSPMPPQQPPELLLKACGGRGRGPRLQGAGEIIANALIGKRPCLILQPMLHVPTGTWRDEHQHTLRAMFHVPTGAWFPSFALAREQALQIRFLHPISSPPLRGDGDK